MKHGLNTEFFDVKKVTERGLKPASPSIVTRRWKKSNPLLFHKSKRRERRAPFLSQSNAGSANGAEENSPQFQLRVCSAKIYKSRRDGGKLKIVSDLSPLRGLVLFWL
jgi:hypothetical protein